MPSLKYFCYVITSWYTFVELSLKRLKPVFTTSVGGIMIIDAGSVLEWLERRDCYRHGLSLKPTHAILLCPGERRFTTLSPVW